MLPMLVKDIGEFHLISTLAKAIESENTSCIERLTGQGFRLRVPIGDDAAAWDEPAGVRVLTTDTMVEGVHFDLQLTGWSDLGWKSLAVNLSDIAAMGCAPIWSVVTLGIREDLHVEDLVEMYRCMMDVCSRFGGAVVGGDIVRSPVLFVTVALEGAVVVCKETMPETGGLLTRHGASPGDEIAVTGHLGCSAAGFRALTEIGGARSQGRPCQNESFLHFKDAHNRPIPRVAEGILLAQHGVVAAMDISDGLINDLGKLCEASNVRAVIRSEHIPADRWLRRAHPKHWLDLALGGGEDYELIFTAPPKIMAKIVSMLEVQVSIIGHITEGQPEVIVLDKHNRPMHTEYGGWDHFQKLQDVY